MKMLRLAAAALLLAPAQRAAADDAGTPRQVYLDYQTRRTAFERSLYTAIGDILALRLELRKPLVTAQYARILGVQLDYVRKLVAGQLTPGEHRVARIVNDAGGRSIVYGEFLHKRKFRKFDRKKLEMKVEDRSARSFFRFTYVHENGRWLIARQERGCHDCLGARSCVRCKATGKVAGRRCSECEGTKICPGCKGTGYQESTLGGVDRPIVVAEVPAALSQPARSPKLLLEAFCAMERRLMLLTGRRIRQLVERGIEFLRPYHARAVNDHIDALRKQAVALGVKAIEGFSAQIVEAPKPTGKRGESASGGMRITWLGAAGLERARVQVRMILEETGWRIASELELCLSCGGKGICGSCAGRGTRAFGQLKARCWACQGAKGCRRCRGQGWAARRVFR